MVNNSDEGQPEQPHHVFKKILWRSTLNLGESLEKSATWTATGVAAIVALLISNLESISKIVPTSSIKASLIVFSISLLFAVFSKQIGMALANGIHNTGQMEAFLKSDQGQELMDGLQTEYNQLGREIAEPFFWPLSSLMIRGWNKGSSDYLAGDKTYVRLFCSQLYLNFLHGILAIVAILILAFSIA